jgi:hypothetical protein
MATLSSVNGEVELSLRLMKKSLDPFQVDLEWFEYDLSIVLHRSAVDAASLNPSAGRESHIERHAIRGKFNRKDFRELLRGIDALLNQDQALRFEPYDLNFYFEWSRETPHVCLIITWFDLGLLPRRLDQRFPTAHAGFRFLAEEDSLIQFRITAEEEFTSPGQPSNTLAAPLIN